MRRPAARGILLAAILSVSLLAGCTSDTETSADCSALEPGPEEVVMWTNEGCMLIELYPDAAPLTVENFLQYVCDGFYEGVIFHRIIEDFVIQGGGFTADGERKETREPIPLEYNLPNTKYTLSMARTQALDSATSQFFINTVDNTQTLGKANGGGYAVFGKVIEGQDVVDGIKTHPTTTGPGGMTDWPQDPKPVIEQATTGADCDHLGEAPEPEFGFETGLMLRSDGDSDVYTVNISNSKDQTAFWILNEGNQEDTFNAMVLSPSHWDVTIDSGEITLPKHSRTRNQEGTYGYAAVGIITIQHLADKVPEGHDTSEDRITITWSSLGDPELEKVIEIQPNIRDPGLDEQITAKGDQITLRYEGSFDNGEVFDSGSFDAEVGSRSTVAGFSYGMLGLAMNETIDIRFPPEFGYGYDQAGNRAQFNGEWLNFEIAWIS